MIVALPICEKRISPIFDTAEKILVFDIRNGKIKDRHEINLDETFLPRRARILADHGIDLLICCGISKAMRSFLTARNIDVINGVIGETELVINAFLTRCLDNERFRMPGCRRCGRRGRNFKGRKRTEYETK